MARGQAGGLTGGHAREMGTTVVDGFSARGEGGWGETQARGGEIRTVAPDREGFAVVRVIAGLPSQNAMANEAVDTVSCSIDAPDEPTGADGKPGG